MNWYGGLETEDFYAFKIDLGHPLPSRGLWTELVKLRSGYRCEDCGVAGRGPGHGRGVKTAQLVSHHIDGNGHLGGFYDRLSNGRSLCQSCHRRAHSRERMELARQKKSRGVVPSHAT